MDVKEDVKKDEGEEEEEEEGEEVEGDKGLEVVLVCGEAVWC